MKSNRPCRWVTVGAGGAVLLDSTFTNVRISFQNVAVVFTHLHVAR